MLFVFTFQGCTSYQHHTTHRAQNSATHLGVVAEVTHSKTSGFSAPPEIDESTANGSLERLVSFRDGFLAGAMFISGSVKASGKKSSKEIGESCLAKSFAGFWAVQNCALMKRTKIAVSTSVPKPLRLRPLQ